MLSVKVGETVTFGVDGEKVELHFSPDLNLRLRTTCRPGLLEIVRPNAVHECQVMRHCRDGKWRAKATAHRVRGATIGIENRIAIEVLGSSGNQVCLWIGVPQTA
ncbi:MAG: hypothetical protein WD278_00975 [Pirellulales bacterium]